MKKMSLFLVALALPAGALVGCSKQAETTTTASTAVSSESKSSSEKSGSGDATTTIGIGNVGGVDMDKLTGDLQKCTDLATAYMAIWAPLAGGGSDADIDAAIKKLDEIKGQVPDKVRTSLETLENGIKNAKGLTGLSEFIASDEYTKADKAVTDYLTNECNKVGQ